jgi:hypothetical protein
VIAASPDDRTLIYTGGVVPTVPAGITAGVDTASSPVGQAAILTAVNILARSHPEILLAVPDVPLVVPSPVEGATLRAACAELAYAARPEVIVTPADHLPAGALSLGVGPDSPQASLYAGAGRWTGLTGSSPLPITPEQSSLIGLGLAVTLATGWLFRQALGWSAVTDRFVSLWTMTSESKPTGPTDAGPVDVGSAWLVGAGAVGSGLAWWLSLLGVRGAWSIIDGDLADVTNLNRSLGLFAADAGLGGGDPIFKVDAAARFIPGSTPYRQWFDEWTASDPPSPDVFIPVANDRGIRSAAATYGHPATIHATTSRHWTAELHRHLPGIDGCVTCRLPDEAPQFACATGPAPPASPNPGRDAALPFLSAAAGLLLASGLLQLQAGEWSRHRRNHWRIFFDESPGQLQSSLWSCRSGCTTTPPPAVRQALHATTRWSGLNHLA